MDISTATRVIYSGDVQGVGFRRRTQRIAEAHAVAGAVRNLADGTVELVVEGEAAAVERFLAAVAASLASHIARADRSPLPPHGMRGFEIRR